MNLDTRLDKLTRALEPEKHIPTSVIVNYRDGNYSDIHDVPMTVEEFEALEKAYDLVIIVKHAKAPLP